VAIVFNQMGDEVVAFVPGDQPIAPEHDRKVPVIWTSTLVKHDSGRYLLLFNPQRNQWELPGGKIEPGEHPDDGARREVQEETSQVVRQLQCRGLLKVRFRADDRQIYGVLYTGTVDQLLPFTANEESERILLWEPGEALDGHFCMIAQTVIDCLEHGIMP
jgi:8-oxo-dGTP pyrophosphatase MutT (NUDIX family)